MTLMLGHELATSTVMLSALLAVLLGGQTDPSAWLSVGVVPVGWVLQWRRLVLPTAIAGVLGLAAVVLGAVMVMQQGSGVALLAAAYALMGLVAVRMFSRQAPADDLQLYALALLLLLDAAALNISWLYAPCFLVFTMAMVWALTTRELKRAAQSEHVLRAATGDPPLWHQRGFLTGRFFGGTGAISVAVLLGTLLLFVAFPRMGFGLLRLGGGGKKSGFSDSVRLGEQGGISQDMSVVIRVTRDGPGSLPTSLYFRGAAYDHYDGATWTRSDAGRGGITGSQDMPAPRGPVTAYRVTQDPSLAPFVFAAGWVSKVSLRPSVRMFTPSPPPFRDGLGDMQVVVRGTEPMVLDVEADIGPVDYAALGDAGQDYPAHISGRYLDHAMLPSRVVELARVWTASATRPLDKVAAISAQLAQFGYTTDDEAAPVGTTPLEHFLFNRRAGHCEYFASALALLTRAVGIPARVAGGYQGGALHPGGGYLVLRQADAHAWTEVFVPGTGWVLVDATPGQILARPPLSLWANIMETIQRQWEEYVVDYSATTQLQVAQGLASWLAELRAASWQSLRPSQQQVLATLTGVLLVLVAVWANRRRRLGEAGPRRSTPAPRLRRALWQTSQRLLGQIPPQHTVAEWTADAGLLLSSQDARTLDEARRAFENTRYGGMPMTRAQEREWVRRVRSLQTQH